MNAEEKSSLHDFIYDAISHACDLQIGLTASNCAYLVCRKLGIPERSEQEEGINDVIRRMLPRPPCHAISTAIEEVISSHDTVTENETPPFLKDK